MRLCQTWQLQVVMRSGTPVHPTQTRCESCLMSLTCFSLHLKSFELLICCFSLQQLRLWDQTKTIPALLSLITWSVQAFQRIINGWDTDSCMKGVCEGMKSVKLHAHVVYCLRVCMFLWGLPGAGVLHLPNPHFICRKMPEFELNKLFCIMSVTWTKTTVKGKLGPDWTLGFP